MIATLLLEHTHLAWLVLGGLLLAAEMLGGNGYLLWSGVAAVVTGLLAWVIPFGWEWQGVLFAVLTMLAAWLWWQWLSRRVKQQKPADASLNGLVNGRGHMRVGDSSWPGSADDDLAAGTRVEVTAVEGITLRIKAVNE